MNIETSLTGLEDKVQEIFRRIDKGQQKQTHGKWKKRR